MMPGKHVAVDAVGAAFRECDADTTSMALATESIDTAVIGFYVLSLD